MSNSPICKNLRGSAPNLIEFDRIKKQAGRNGLNQIAIQQMKLLTTDPRLPRLPGGGGR
jgi:hypothetical protein